MATASVMGLGTTIQRVVTPKASTSLPESCSNHSTSSLCIRKSGNSAPGASLIRGCQLRSEFNPKFAARKITASVSKSVQSLTARAFASDPEQLKAAREDIITLLHEKHCHPILIRLGWHDAGTFDKNIEEFPTRGGANGSLRYSIELGHAANAGLTTAIKLISSVKEKYPNISYADLFQLGSATAIEDAGGPKIPLRFGRKDTAGPEECVKEGNLPDAGPPSPAEHLRKVFYRMGLSDQDIVALSGEELLCSDVVDFDVYSAQA